MKKSNLLLNLLLAVVFMGFVTACEDDPVVVEKPGIPVADGMYITMVDVDPVANQQLKPAKVDAPSFGAMDREGFVQSYVYLTPGNYNIFEVIDKEITEIIGGTLTTVSGEDVHNKECDSDNSSYSLIADATTGGAAFAIAREGMYVVAYDDILGEIVFDQIESASIIGGATPGGWGADTPMTGTITADGMSFSVEGVTLDVNQMKFRFNCRWAIDRRIDTGVDFDNANGYSFFTNYGGTFNQLLPGNEGPNIEVTEYAVYTVTFDWDPVVGASATLTKTGEAEPKPDYPTELYMIGGSIGGWTWTTNDIEMIPVHSNDHLFWAIVWMYADADIPGGADGGIKFAPVQDWNGDFGKSGDATDGVYAKGSDNVPGPATSGYKMVVVNLEPGAETIEVNDPIIYGIGDAFGSWDQGMNMFTVDNVNEVVNSPAASADGNIRMYTTASTFTPIGTGPAVEWWQAEFNIIGGVIEYRAKGGDQTAVPVTAGQVASLMFKDGTGSIQ